MFNGGMEAGNHVILVIEIAKMEVSPIVALIVARK